MNPTNTTVLVTGGCGFIGTWVLRELQQRGLRSIVLDAGERPPRWNRILGPDSHAVTLVQGGLLDRDLLARIFSEHSITHVIHLAALLTPACKADPWEGCQVNVMGTVALLEQIRKARTPIRGISFASSVAVFGDEADHARGDAEATSHPVTFYGAFKHAVEVIAEQYWREFRLPSLGIRPQVAYGPERTVGLTAGPSLAARAVARGTPYCIEYQGRLGYDYAEDIARAFVRGALETPPGAQVVDLPGEIADVPQVIAALTATAPEAATLLTQAGPTVPTHAPPRPNFIQNLYPDWPITSLAEGMRKTLQFYSDHPEA